MTLGGPRWALLGALWGGCAPRVQEPAGGPPRVRAEAVELVGEGTVLRAAEAEAEAREDASVRLRAVELTRGPMHVRAGRAEGVFAGPWSLTGGVQGYVAGVLAQIPSADAGAALRVELSADRMRLDPRGRTATLEGAVTIRRGGVQIESQRVVVRYGGDGRVVAAEASGPVTARTAEGVLVAPAGARADFAAGTLTLLGRVRVSQAGAVIEGDGVEVDLATGAIELRAVRGWLPTSPR